MTSLMFTNMTRGRYVDIADKLDELANSISCLPEVDQPFIERIRKLSLIVRAEQGSREPTSIMHRIDIFI
jgi:hypothetical protein